MSGFNVARSHRAKYSICIAGAPAIYTEATIQTEWDRLKGYPMHPAVGYFVCGRTSVHILLGGSSSHATQRATLDRLTAGLRLTP